MEYKPISESHSPITPHLNPLGNNSEKTEIELDTKVSSIANEMFKSLSIPSSTSKKDVEYFKIIKFMKENKPTDMGPPISINPNKGEISTKTPIKEDDMVVIKRSDGSFNFAFVDKIIYTSPNSKSISKIRFKLDLFTIKSLRLNELPGNIFLLSGDQLSKLDEYMDPSP
jgi:hypothetical protein